VNDNANNLAIGVDNNILIEPLGARSEPVDGAASLVVTQEALTQALALAQPSNDSNTSKDLNDTANETIEDIFEAWASMPDPDNIRRDYIHQMSKQHPTHKAKVHYMYYAGPWDKLKLKGGQKPLQEYDYLNHLQFRPWDRFRVVLPTVEQIPKVITLMKMTDELTAVLLGGVRMILKRRILQSPYSYMGDLYNQWMQWKDCLNLVCKQYSTRLGDTICSTMQIFTASFAKYVWKINDLANRMLANVANFSDKVSKKKKITKLHENAERMITISCNAGTDFPLSLVYQNRPSRQGSPTLPKLRASFGGPAAEISNNAPVTLAVRNDEFPNNLPRLDPYQQAAIRVTMLPASQESRDNVEGVRQTAAAFGRAIENAIFNVSDQKAVTAAQHLLTKQSRVPGHSENTQRAPKLELKHLHSLDDRTERRVREDPCSECTGKRDPYHLMSQCPYFLDLTPRERQGRIDKWGKCRRCFRNGHSANNVICRGRPCKWCGSEDHNSLLHGANLDTRDGMTEAQCLAKALDQVMERAAFSKHDQETIYTVRNLLVEQARTLVSSQTKLEALRLENKELKRQAILTGELLSKTEQIRRLQTERSRIERSMSSSLRRQCVLDTRAHEDNHPGPSESSMARESEEDTEEDDTEDEGQVIPDDYYATLPRLC